MLNVSTHTMDHRVLVALEGRLDGSPHCSDLSAEVKSKLGEGSRDFLIDLDGVEWMSSCGIGCLISTYASIRRAGGTLVLRRPNQRVMAALRVTDLVPSVFEVIDPPREESE